MKMLLTCLGILATTLSTGAYAANSIGYDFRGDYNSTSYNEAAQLPGYQKLHLKTGRLYFKGTLNERVSYELRWGFYKPSVESVNTTTGVPSNASRDGLNSSIEYANITDKMSDMFSLQLGKLSSDIGGLDGATSGADLYMVSPNYAHSAVTTLSVGKNLGFNQSGANNLLYTTGAKGDFAFSPEQHLYLVFSNNVGDSVDTAGKFNQNRGLMGVIWKGSFMEKALSAIASYHEISPQGAATDPGNKHSFYSAGVKYDDPQWLGSLDYTTTDYKDGASSNKDTLWSAVAKFGWKMDAWTPRLELFTAEEKIGITAPYDTNKYMGYGAIVEYKPTPENFRYHLAYNSITTKPQTGSDQIKSEIVLGARLFGDFLK